MRRSILVALAAVLALVLLVGAAGWIVWHTVRRSVAEQLRPAEKTVDLTSVVTQVRELNRLETASMHVIHIGRVTQTYQMIPNALAGDEITFLAAGDVIAGVDLARLQPHDVWRSSDGVVNLRLPPAQILVSRVDNGESRVLNRSTGMLRRADVDLETRARQHAEENIRKEALRKGILPLASKNAEAKLASLLHTLGVERVRFVTGPTEPTAVERPAR